ncbi:MAG: sugar ABC transporter ATP-binding protein [Oscillospiraceae bacterium]|nr:sugar ABC transporter ATP-binding protein [Oscillospiraceae bacterium]
MLEMTNIFKSFFGVTVVSDVNFHVGTGEVHALLGENGAGKSTLMNVLGGVHERDSGTIIFDGKTMNKITPTIAAEHGIAFVHQELNLFNDLLVFENIFLKRELVTKLGHLRKKEMIREVQALFDSLGISISPTALVSDLTTSEKQLLEISKALRSDSKLFILDEPTTALGNQEIENLFAIVRRLKEQGKSFIFISHKMPEVFAITDTFTVLRNGHFVASGATSDSSPEEITRYMVGDSFDDSEAYKERDLGEPILELVNYSGFGFEDVNLSVRRGEIFGLTGLQGAGCSEIMQTMFGAMPASGGTFKVRGKLYNGRSIRSAMRKRIGMVPANRKERSIIPDMNLVENTALSLNTLTGKQPIVSKRGELTRYRGLENMLNIKGGKWQNLIVSLSGGNQQKVILARWLNTEADILFLDNPTQGIDVGAKAEIYRLIVELSEQGKTILINSLEIPEIQKIADRCAVFYHRKLQVILDRKNINEETVMLHATGAASIADGGKEGETV